MGTRGTPEKRMEEADAAAKAMGLAWRGNLRFPDARLENNIAARMTLAAKIRELQPQTVILPYWEGRHPDHYRCCELGYEACFLAGLKKLDPYTEPHRPFKILYSSLYADVKPSFVVDISSNSSAAWRRCSATSRNTATSSMAAGCFRTQQEIRERLGAIARFYGNLIGVKYGEPFVVKEAIQIDDIVSMPVRSI